VVVETAVTIPVWLTVATAVLALVHTPPVVVFVILEESVEQIVILETLLAFTVGLWLTVIFLVAAFIQVPLPTVYLITDEPILTGVITPEAASTVATAVLLLLQTPLAVASVNVVVFALQTVDVPEMAATVIAELTVIL